MKMTANCALRLTVSTLILALASCGGGGGSTTPVNPPPVNPPAVLTITTSSLADASPASYYDVEINSTGQSNSVWSVSSGTLPAGLTLLSMGPSARISGYATTEGSSTFSLTVRDATGAATRAFTIRVAYYPIVITTESSLPDANSGSSYTQWINATGGTGNYTWSLESGSLPPQLSFNGLGSTSVLNGVCRLAGNYNFTIKVTDGTRSTSKAFSLKVNLVPLALQSSSVGDGVKGQLYDGRIFLSGGSGTRAWSIVSGALPPGVRLIPDDVYFTSVYGTATSVGTYTFTIRVGDDSTSLDLPFTVRISEPLKITSPAPPTARTDEPYSFQLQATGGLAPLTWSAQNPKNWPPGFTITPDGILQGTTWARDTFDVWVLVTDSATPAQQMGGTYRLTVLGPIEVLTKALPKAVVNKQYSAAPLVGIGGVKPYTWSISAGVLPAGLTLNPTEGTITGTPAGPTGVATFTLKITDSSATPLSATRDFSVNVQSNLGRNDTLETATFLYTHGWLQTTASLSPYADPPDVANPDSDYYRLTATPGTLVSVGAISYSPAEPVIEILDENGVRFSTCDTETWGGTDVCLAHTHGSDPNISSAWLYFTVPGRDKTIFYVHVLDYYGDARPDYEYQLSISSAD